jgi:hypothetical protein
MYIKTTRRTFIKQSALTAATLSWGSLLCESVGHAQTAPPPPDYSAQPEIKDATDPSNRVPYISQYFIPHKVDVDKEVTISYYVTDYEQKEYLRDDFSERFTIEYWVNGAKSTLKGVKAGDNSFVLQGLPKGRVLLAFQATDSTGRRSHRLFQELLVVDPKEEAIPAAKVFHPDLKQFGISNDNTHPVETTKGLTEMLKWASDNGYRKVLLPQGTYRLDENEPVRMATKLTLDMNGATFKLNPSALASIVMFEIANCFDSHVINGVIEGDWTDRNEQNLKKSEHVRGVSMGQDATYCSFEKLKVTNITGYGTTTWMGVTGSNSYIKQSKNPGKFALGDIDDKGQSVPSEVRATGPMVDVSGFRDGFGFFQMGLYLGYQGSPVDGWVYRAHFYDADQKYLETIDGMLYRRLYVPKNAQFVRITTLGATFSDSLRLFDFRHPYNCAFRNVAHEDVRCVGMAPSGFYNLLVENCSFERCGSASAKCAFDAEDGWDMMQDLTFRNNTFRNNPFNDYVTVGGRNFVAENNVMDVNMLGNKSTVYRNNKIGKATYNLKARKSSGFPRIYGNTFSGPVTVNITVPIPNREYCLKDNVCNGGVSARLKVSKKYTGEILPNAQNVLFFYKCKITSGPVEAQTVQCELPK